MNLPAHDYVAHRRESDGATQSLESHLLGVAEKAKRFAGKLGLEPQGELAGLIHDLGKYSSEFQAYIGSATGLINPDEDDFVVAEDIRGKVDHSTAGAQLVWETLSKASGIGEVVGQILALCIASHHSGLIDCLSSDANRPVEDNFTRRIGKPEIRSHLQETRAKMDASVGKRFHELVNSAELVEGLREAVRQIALREGDRGASSDRNPIVQIKIGLLVRLLFSCLLDADRIDTADFEKPRAAKGRLRGRYTRWDALIERFEQGLRNFQTRNAIDDIRRRVSDHCRDSASREKGIFTLTVPTGGGKTFGSLRFALHHARKWEMDRIIYVVPFTTIIDQNAKEVRKLLERTRHDRGRIVLEHHSNLTPEVQGWKEKMLTEDWDAPVVFTTSVQFLEALFGAGTRGARRMHQLANSVLIFDEVQSVPVNCVHLFTNAVNFLVEHCGSTAVLCTATQPLLNGVDPNRGAMRYTAENEIMPDVDQLFQDLRRVEVLNRRKPGGWSNDEIVQLAMEEVDKSGSCLVIVNTKRSAQELFRICRSHSSIPLYHLSTNMCAAHRRRILDEICLLLGLPGRPLLCISTQLIEAGVDIDFGSVIRFTAGLDSVAQAAGRCNRHMARKRGRVHVVNPSDESLDRLSDIRCGKNVTERLMDEADAGEWHLDGNLLGPDALNRYFYYYFFDRREEMAYPVPPGTIGRQDTLLNLLSSNQVAVSEFGRIHGVAPNIYLRQSFMAASKAFKAIDAPTRGVIVPYGMEGNDLIADLCAAFEVEKQHKLLRKAQQYTVNVFPNTLAQLQKAGAIRPIQKDVDILYLDKRYYNQEFGITLTAEGNMEVLCA